MWALELEAFFESGLMYEGLEQQDHMKLEVFALEDTAQEDLVSEIVVCDARSGEELDLNLVRVRRLRELGQMDKHQCLSRSSLCPGLGPEGQGQGQVGGRSQDPGRRDRGPEPPCCHGVQRVRS